MDALTLRDAAMESLRKLDLEVRLEHLGGNGGGACSVKGRRILFVDLDADAESQLETCLTALRDLPGLDSLYLAPALRERLA